MRSSFIIMTAYLIIIYGIPLLIVILAIFAVMHNQKAAKKQQIELMKALMMKDAQKSDCGELNSNKESERNEQ